MVYDGYPSLLELLQRNVKLREWENVDENIPEDSVPQEKECEENLICEDKKSEVTKETKQIPDKTHSEQLNGKQESQKQNSKDSNIFPCTFCPEILTLKDELLDHMKQHGGDIILFSCLLCEKTFNNLHNLRTHQVCHESRCDYCHKLFRNQDELDHHLSVCTLPCVTITERSKYFCTCPVCDQGFTHPRHLATHVKIHKKDRTRCVTCGKSFTNLTTLKYHIVKHHKKSDQHLCTECGRSFITSSMLKVHMRRHRGVKPHECLVCQKSFPRLCDLKVHQRYHYQEKKFACFVCSKRFTRSCDLVTHKRIHTGEKPYVCSYCDRSFAQVGDLKTHIRRHTGERFHCDLCSEDFLHGYMLTRHMEKTHGAHITTTRFRKKKTKSEEI